jgi:catechol 2,3-dioxygenase-like lactoylglutathione lyase family enzyme
MSIADSNAAWPAAYRVAQVCMTRPTARFDEVLAFYRDGLGLPVLFQFDAGGGVKGGMVGLPGAAHHLEFIQAADAHAGAACGPPNKQHVLVLHIPERAEVQRLAAALAARGHPAVAPANPYWTERAVVVEDPEGWPVVLAIGSGLGAAHD